MSFTGNKGRGVDQGFHILAIKLLKMQRSACTGYHTPDTSSALVQSMAIPAAHGPTRRKSRGETARTN